MEIGEDGEGFFVGWYEEIGERKNTTEEMK